MQTVKRKARGLWRPKKKTKPNNSSTTVGQQYGGGNDWTVSTRRVGYRKKPTLSRLARMMEVGMHKQIFRFQGLTRFDTNVGFYKLWNALETSTNSVNLPVHIYDLTSFNNIGNYSPARRFGWTSQATTADCGTANLPCQNAAGATDVAGPWILENGEGTVTNSRIMRHDWSDIRFNFYGPRKRTTKFEVMFVRVKDELANPLIAGASNASFKDLMNYLERPCIFSNLQTFQPHIAKKMRIVKKYTYWVSAGQTTDVDTTVGKIKEARIFMRHDRIYNLDWRHEGGADLAHGADDGIDFVQDQLHHNGPWYGSRLLMIVRAFAPERRSVVDYSAAADALTDPTYDILIRNCVSTPA